MNSKIVTFGCRLNTFESSVIESLIKTEDNLIVVNTCAVTKEAERQARQSIRKIRRENPSAQIIVTGCAAQINPGQFTEMPEVDKVLGNEEKMIASNYVNIQNSPKAIVNDIMSVKETAGHMANNFGDKTRAFIQIQNGCNHRCTFCIIPYGRGNSRSVPIAEVVNQIKILVDNGYQEVVLTGVDITDYGLDLPAAPKLGMLVRRILSNVPSLRRLRLSSIDVAEIDDELIELMMYEERCLPHYHISLQSGDNLILKRMKRRHTREMVIEFCNNLRAKREGVSFGADIIAGFPTENEEMFENTLRLISEAGLQFLHVFPYSSRANTPAARMPQVEMSIRKRRAAILRQAGEEEMSKFMAKLVGLDDYVLIENGNKGRLGNFVPIEILDAEPGSIVRAQVVGFTDHNMLRAVECSF